MYNSFGFSKEKSVSEFKFRMIRSSKIQIVKNLQKTNKSRYEMPKNFGQFVIRVYEQHVRQAMCDFLLVSIMIKKFIGFITGKCISKLYAEMVYVQEIRNYI